MLSGAASARADSAATPWIERRDGLDRREFRARYLPQRRPVVLENAVKDWPALGRFTPDWFRRQHGDAAVRVRGRTGRLGDVIDLQVASTAARPAPYPCTLVDTDALRAELAPRPGFSLPSRCASRLIPRSVFKLVRHVEIFFGGPGGEFPYLHYDMLRLHTWVVQVYGQKQFTLYEPGQEHLLYRNPRLPWLSMVQDPTDHARYPLLREARSHQVTLGAGDALFIPCGVWHTARCVSMNISVAFDQLEATNWNEFVTDAVAEQRRSGRRLQARALGSYLRALGPLFGLADWFGAHRQRGSAASPVRSAAQPASSGESHAAGTAR